MIDKALAPSGKGKVFCPDCGTPIPVRDAMEEKFESPAIKEQVRRLQEEGQHEIDTASLELILIGHAYSVSREAGQLFHPLSPNDHGLDAEIEFKDQNGHPSGKRLYLQLKSADSCLTDRSRDTAPKVLQIKNPHWLEYWQQQPHPVMLVIRTPEGEILWMDITTYLKRETAPTRQITQIPFEGERFSALSVREWRDRMLQA